MGWINILKSFLVIGIGLQTTPAYTATPKRVTKIPVPTKRPTPPNLWGDARITEAYNKNKAARGHWFRQVDDRAFSDQSTLAKKIIAGWSPPVEIARKAGRYFFMLSPDESAAVLTDLGEDTGTKLDPGIVVEVEIVRSFQFNSDTQDYREKILPSPYIKFRIVNPLPWDTVKEGYIHIDNLYKMMLPPEDVSKLKRTYELYIERLRTLYERQDRNLNLAGALRQFHSSICEIEGSGQQALWAKWDAFVRSKTDPRARQVALNARHVDLVSRTVTGEYIPQDLMLDPTDMQSRTRAQFHPDAESCQIDIITTVIRNRAFDANFKQFHAEFPGDFSGVVRPGDQFNPWLSDAMQLTKNRITSCPYSKSATYHDRAAERYPGYKAFRSLYTTLIDRVPTILGIKDPAIPAMDDQSQLTSLFIVDPEERLSESEQISRLTKMVNFYHPMSMVPRGNMLQALNPHRPALLKNGIVRVIYRLESGEAWRFYPVVNGRVVLGSGERHAADLRVRIRGTPVELQLEGVESHMANAYEFEVFDNRNKPPKWIAARDFFAEPEVSVQIEAQLLEYGLEGQPPALLNARKVLLPNGLFPQCFEKDGFISQDALKNGIAAPVSWFAGEIRNEAVSAFNRLMAGETTGAAAFQGGSYFGISKPTPKGMVPIKVICRDSKYYRPSVSGGTLRGYPEFGGLCDPNVMLARMRN